MLDQVLLNPRNRWQTLGASLGVFIALFLLLFSLQIYLDIQVLTQGASDNNFLIINKDFAKNKREKLSFSPEEIVEMREQPFISQVDAFESNTYQVALSSTRMRFTTLLFFQSIPSIYLDVDTTLFQWKPGDNLPIVLSSDYLTLYNFGFAPSQGLPRFSAETISLVDFTVTIGGQGKRESFTAYVAGFTPNINSILVPPEFMAYANATYGDSIQAKAPTQVIAETDNPYSLALEEFLDQEGYEVSRGGLIGGELKSTLYLLLALVVVIGLIIVSLALLVFILNFQVLVAQASQDIRLLLQLGYRIETIAGTLSRRLLTRFSWLAGGVFVLLFLIKYSITASVIEQGYALGYFPNVLVLVAGVALCALFIFINHRSIQQNVQDLA